MPHLMTEKETLREQITNKFRSLAYFCVLTETNYKKTLAYFCSDDYDSVLLEELQYKLDNTEVDEQHGLIRDEDRKAIRICVLTNFKNYSAFHRKHKEYDSVYLSNIVGGRLSDETEKYQNLIRLLTAEYDLDVMIWYRIKKVSKLDT